MRSTEQLAAQQLDIQQIFIGKCRGVAGHPVVLRMMLHIVIRIEIGRATVCLQILLLQRRTTRTKQFIDKHIPHNALSPAQQYLQDFPQPTAWTFHSVPVIMSITS